MDGVPARLASGTAVSGGFRYLGEEVRDEGWRIRLVTASFEAPDGERFTRDVVRHPGAVAVVPVTDRGTALLVRQYRGPVDAELLEIPAGTRDHDGEPPEQTAGRELAEEVGVRADAIVPLCTMYNTPGFCDEETIVYLATGLRACPTGRQGPEEGAMTVHEVALAEVERLVADGTLVDGQTILGLLLARTRLAAGVPPAAGGS